MSKIYIGTSGYYYKDWKGNFYPDKLKNNEFLNYYSNYFNTVELNFTFYSFPKSYIFRNLLTKVLQYNDFIFSVKAHSCFTHERIYSVNDLKNFLFSIEPLKTKNKLGCILFQFPYSFYFNLKNLDYLKKLLEDFFGLNKAVEFRHISWLNLNVIKTLRYYKVGFCNVDEPRLKGLLPPTDIVTDDFSYIRFHGRNSENWWNSKKSFQRYDYMYSQKELEEWLPLTTKILSKSSQTFIYFNNHYKAKAAKSALMFINLLKNNNNIPSQN